MNSNLTDIELSMVCDFIASRMGLHFPVERWVMLRRNLVLTAMEFGFQDMGMFIQWLLSASPDRKEMEVLAANLTISETYFWREPQVFAALTDFILPELIRLKSREQGARNKEIEERSDEIPRSGKGEKSIRIWSAGCSTGEEPYSIAIALHKTIPKINDWNITILATDINPRALSKAITGTYSAWSFRNSPVWLKSNYFLNKGNLAYEIIPEIKRMVTFTCLSLAEMSAIGNSNSMDIIFCRNVLMYFTPGWISKIANGFYQELTDDGWFIVSSCELSSQVFPQFTAVNFPGAIIYRKTRNGSAISHNINTLSSSAFSAPADFPITPSSHHPISPSPSLPLTFSAIHEPQLTREESAATKIFSIRMLADQGHLEEALTSTNEALACYKLSPGLYFLRASILQELGKNTEAIASLKQAIYIDPDYIMGHFMLGNLFVKQGNPKNAKRFFENVLDLLHKYENNDILPDSEGLSAKYLREIIITNMDTIHT
jgi:chemotaxis protein methyltransferase CheR